MDLLGLAIYILIAFLILIFIVIIVFLFKENNKINPRYKNDRSSGKPFFSKENKTSDLEKELILLTNGNRDTAKRLVDNIKFRNPRKSLKWCYEKAIYDLKRDRNAT